MKLFGKIVAVSIGSLISATIYEFFHLFADTKDTPVERGAFKVGAALLGGYVGSQVALFVNPGLITKKS